MMNFRQRSGRVLAWAAAGIVSVVLSAAPANAEDVHDHDEHGPARHRPAGTEAGDHRHAHPHVDLEHPLVGESPLPETHLKFRFNHFDGGDETSQSAAAELEYAFVPEFSLEAVLPYTWVNPEEGPSGHGVDSAEVAFKMASFYWLDRNLLPAVGLGIGLPTGNEEEGIGSDHEVELEPFVRVGWWAGDFELIGGLSAGIPLNRKGDEKDEADFALGYALSALYHISPDIHALVELTGESAFGGADGDEHAFYISPGLTTHPFPDKSIILGAGVSLPLTDDREFDYAVNVLLIFHL